MSDRCRQLVLAILLGACFSPLVAQQLHADPVNYQGAMLAEWHRWIDSMTCEPVDDRTPSIMPSEAPQYRGRAVWIAGKPDGEIER